MVMDTGRVIANMAMLPLLLLVRLLVFFAFSLAQQRISHPRARAWRQPSPRQGRTVFRNRLSLSLSLKALFLPKGQRRHPSRRGPSTTRWLG
jgi:hypothetical protein